MAKDESKVTAEEFLAYIKESLDDLTQELAEFLEPEEEKEPSQMTQAEYETYRKRGGGR